MQVFSKSRSWPPRGGPGHPQDSMDTGLQGYTGLLFGNLAESDGSRSVVTRSCNNVALRFGVSRHCN